MQCPDHLVGVAGGSQRRHDLHFAQTSHFRLPCSGSSVSGHPPERGGLHRLPLTPAPGIAQFPSAHNCSKGVSRKQGTLHDLYAIPHRGRGPERKISGHLRSRLE
ncbi:hypothetical protein Ga0080559_TMP2595 [Salipiger profundus]|uniref:Uncharacterized protein n=1 Tax=Salipiger profundus TaxID=1229727 RepID=A0A1U7D5G5_9RHOB|nr:hypothetical protein Ga0080559_TMP2595 [Salipiger profundus]